MMKLMSLKQYMNMSKPALIRKIMKTLKAMPKKKLALACYNLTKSKLPALKVIKRKALPYSTKRYNIYEKRVRKASPKQIAWRKKFAKMSKAGTLRKRRRR